MSRIRTIWLFLLRNAMMLFFLGEVWFHSHWSVALVLTVIAVYVELLGSAVKGFRDEIMAWTKAMPKEYEEEEKDEDL